MRHRVLPGERDRYVGGMPLRIGTRGGLLIDGFMVEDRLEYATGYEQAR